MIGGPFVYDDPDDEIEVLTLADDVVIRVLSASTPETYLTSDVSTLEALCNGSYSGEPVYGMGPDTPAPMNITVEDGPVTVIESAYLP